MLMDRPGVTGDAEIEGVLEGVVAVAPGEDVVHVDGFDPTSFGTDLADSP